MRGCHRSVKLPQFARLSTQFRRWSACHRLFELAVSHARRSPRRTRGSALEASAGATRDETLADRPEQASRACRRRRPDPAEPSRDRSVPPATLPRSFSSGWQAGNYRAITAVWERRPAPARSSSAVQGGRRSPCEHIRTEVRLPAMSCCTTGSSCRVQPTVPNRSGSYRVGAGEN
jgi:hypothetical protein